MGDLFMSLIHTCGAERSQCLRLSPPELQRHAEQLQAKPIGVDAVELSRYVGTAGYARRRVIL